MYLSEEEIKQMEAEASFTVQQVLVSAVLLYLCKCPHSQHQASRALTDRPSTAPFAVDLASKVL
ncbi:hypothetical protein Brms1b_009629 [Colletotrichum noveboracense]|nr:hypothetical protein CBS470a_006855 [Colletotrichum nupharicola]KAJ0308163.1 hypothetical protein Brms1b_009629 [Colletotrichum noveboracense]